jgi:hypothetical protein
LPSVAIGPDRNGLEMAWKTLGVTSRRADGLNDRSIPAQPCIGFLAIIGDGAVAGSRTAEIALPAGPQTARLPFLCVLAPHSGACRNVSWWF